MRNARTYEYQSCAVSRGWNTQRRLTALVVRNQNFPHADYVFVLLANISVDTAQFTSLECVAAFECLKVRNQTTLVVRNRNFPHAGYVFVLLANISVDTAQFNA